MYYEILEGKFKGEIWRLENKLNDYEFELVRDLGKGSYIFNVKDIKKIEM